jgi:hypothetical protein
MTNTHKRMKRALCGVAFTIGLLSLLYIHAYIVVSEFGFQHVHLQTVCAHPMWWGMLPTLALSIIAMVVAFAGWED